MNFIIHNPQYFRFFTNKRCCFAEYQKSFPRIKFTIFQPSIAVHWTAFTRTSRSRSADPVGPSLGWKASTGSRCDLQSVSYRASTRDIARSKHKFNGDSPLEKLRRIFSTRDVALNNAINRSGWSQTLSSYWNVWPKIKSVVITSAWHSRSTW